MTGWPSDELERAGRAEELQITTACEDGALRAWAPLGAVRVGDDPIVRSYPGANGAWCRHVTGLSRGRIRAGGVERDVTFTATTPQSSEIDRTYRAKYSRYAGS